MTSLSRAKMSKVLRVLTSACLVIGILAGSPVGGDTGRTRSATAQPKTMSLGEVTSRIPAGVTAPSDEKIKQAMEQVQNQGQPHIAWLLGGG